MTTESVTPDSTTILVAAEATWVREQVRAAFVSPGQTVVEVDRGHDVVEAVDDHEPDLVILDMQIANMGGIAVAIDLRLEAAEDRLPSVRILLLLDRVADKFLARRADADAELVKPVDAGTLRRVANRLLALPLLAGLDAVDVETGGEETVAVASKLVD